MTQISDAKAALIAYLLADTDTATEVGTRVYGDKLPRADTDDMARKAVVVASGGGGLNPVTRGTMTLNEERYDFFCYGATLFEAEEVRRAVHGALRALKRETISSVLLHSAEPAGGASTGLDPVTDWPVKWNSWTILADERTVA
ncbi:hypothetical protein LCGC14_0746910 [marine sediment metagenome]|uniref:Uncharacterized protein n=1 Tax=marine sediment metagenome TaxID=412755 RepID=A0A0F9Q540_9ZZZZ